LVIKFYLRFSEEFAVAASSIFISFSRSMLQNHSKNVNVFINTIPILIPVYAPHISPCILPTGIQEWPGGSTADFPMI
jgi:hypothetical protein